ncbi:hypothetical protein ACFVKB_05065 [Rhodococcus sp. NPDC127530]|uniref:hypothetical protein n=1 Tax=unclassified Rhodococcus (in: high G+C Gram-positive bacteria) TaxID=192944 RepID=UPI0036272B8A
MRAITRGGDRFSPAHRPPADALPADVAKLLTELDTAKDRLRTAQRESEHLGHRERDIEAQATDAETAAKAARAGKTIPAPAAAAKLDADRDAAVRAIAAHQAAVRAITGDLDEAATAAVDAARPGPEARQKVDEAAAALSAALEEAVAGLATFDWLNGAGYSATAETFIVDVHPKLDQYRITRDNGLTTTARHTVTGIVSALLGED